MACSVWAMLDSYTCSQSMIACLLCKKCLLIVLVHRRISRRENQMTRTTGTIRRQTHMRCCLRVRARRSTTDTCGYAVMERTMPLSVCHSTLFVVTGMKMVRLQPWLHYCATTAGSSLATFATENSGMFPQFLTAAITRHVNTQLGHVYVPSAFVLTSTHL